MLLQRVVRHGEQIHFAVLHVVPVHLARAWRLDDRLPAGQGGDGRQGGLPAGDVDHVVVAAEQHIAASSDLGALQDNVLGVVILVEQVTAADGSQHFAIFHCCWGRASGGLLGVQEQLGLQLRSAGWGGVGLQLAANVRIGEEAK